MFKSLISMLALGALAFILPPASFGQKAKETAKEEEARLLGVLAKADASRKAKADACRELARVGTREAVAPLAALLDDAELAHMARYGLEPIPDPAVDAALRDALGKLQGRHLVGVIGSIGVRHDAKAVDALSKKLGDSDPEVAHAAARALGRIGTLDAASALDKALASAPEANRPALCEGLLRGADALRIQGQSHEASAIYERLAEASVPEYIRQAAKRSDELLKARSR